MNELVRLSLVINTNHSKFITNLMHVIVYILDCSKRELTVEEIQEYAEEKIYLVFTENEIRLALKEGIKSEYVTKFGADQYILGVKGQNVIGVNNDKIFNKVISKYVTKYDVGHFLEEDIASLIYRYIYNSLNGNIEIILGLLKKENKGEIFEKKNDEYSEEEKRIINDFLEWEDDEKNSVLYRIISFSVDYCRMTAKQNTTSFKGFFKGKVFFLDANIFYRLLGINNKEREKTITQFITKCRDVGVNLRYSNYTKEEVFDSLEYNISKLKKALGGITASPEKVNILMSHSGDISLYNAYYKWALQCNGFGEFDEFIEYLKSKFYVITNQYGISQVQFEDAESHSKEVYEEKCNNLAFLKRIEESVNRKKTVQIDAQNVFNLRRIRGRNKDGNAWSVNHFMISADHNLIKWSNDEFTSEIPLVVLPSVWYSIMLKLCGRTKDDYRAYMQFMKIRYAHSTSSNISSVLYNISNITDSRVLQDKIIDHIINNNKDEVASLQEEVEIQQAVEKAYKDVLAETEQKGFFAGVEKGKGIGFEEGKGVGFEEGKKRGYSNGVELGKLNAKLEVIEEKIAKKSKLIRRRNIGIFIVSYLIIVLLLILQWKFKFISINTLNEIGIYISIGTFLIPVTIANYISVFTKKFLPVDLVVIENKVRSKFQESIDEICEEMDGLNNDV